MKSYSTYLAEAKNTHMEHIEDMMFNEGKSGALKAMKFLRDLRDYLDSGSTKAVNSTVKWDGAPAIIAVADNWVIEPFVGQKPEFSTEVMEQIAELAARLHLAPIDWFVSFRDEMCQKYPCLQDVPVGSLIWP